MPASPQDKFKKVGANTVTSLAAPGKNLAATSINVGSTTNYPTDTGLVIGIRIVDSNGNAMPGTYTEWNGMYDSPTSLTIESTPVYGTDQVYGAGATTQVFLMVSSSLHNQMVDGLLVSHDQDGKLKAGAISNSNMLANNTVTTAAITDASVTAEKLANSTIRLASVTRAATQNVTSIGSNVELTGTSITFTIPEGGRDVEIVHYVSHTQPTGGTIVEYRVWDGSVDGTQIGGATHKYNDAGHAKPLNIFTILSAPAAGTKTIKISAHTDTNNINIHGYSIAPITVSAKLI